MVIERFKDNDMLAIYRELRAASASSRILSGNWFAAANAAEHPDEYTARNQQRCCRSRCTQHP